MLKKTSSLDPGPEEEHDDVLRKPSHFGEGKFTVKKGAILLLRKKPHLNASMIRGLSLMRKELS